MDAKHIEASLHLSGTERRKQAEIVKNCEKNQHRGGKARGAAPRRMTKPRCTHDQKLLLLHRGLSRRRRFFARRNVGHAGHARDLAPGRVVDADAVVIKQRPSSAVQFDARLLVGDRGIDQSRFGCRELALVLQNERRGRGAELIFLLLGIEGLACQFDRGFGGIHTGTVLLHCELRVADFDPHLVFDLLQPHLGLAVFQL